MYYEMNGNMLPQIRLVDKAAVKPPYVHVKRQTEEFVMYVVVKGKLYLQEQGEQYMVSEGDIILLDPEYTHYGIRATECEYYYIHFRHPHLKKCFSNDFTQKGMAIRNAALYEESNSWEQYRENTIYLPKYISLGNKEVYNKILRLVREAMENNAVQLENYKIFCACRLMEAFVEIGREALSQEALSQMPELPRAYLKVQDILQYLNENYAKDISGKMIEEKFSTNYDYINRVFKKTTGKTIFVYLNEIRIRRAKEILGTCSMKVAAVGYLVGFQDEYYFSKVFKKFTGTSPSQYEKLTFGLSEHGEMKQIV